jgi:hypothetical protein
LIDLRRDVEVLELARREAVGWFASSGATPDGVARLLNEWSSRFKLFEVG